MSVRMSKIMCMPKKVRVCMYAMYANCCILDGLNTLSEEDERLCLIIVNIRAEGKPTIKDWW